MAGELVAQLDPGAFFREMSAGYDIVNSAALTGRMRGLSFQKINPLGASGTPPVESEWYNTIVTIPANLTMSTGLTFYILVTDDGTDAADLGKVAKFGITIKRLAAGETTDLTAAAGTEQSATVALSATSGALAIYSLAIGTANLDSAVVGDAIAVRIRRMGADSADTCNGRVIAIGGYVKNT